ncbi:hypothetical protein [Nannocystis radixulma]|uniref:Uncharacterized protein n=1 Tax=Nannocystis radixulma TaxID=2995305 RepID=A0ABT5AYQ0_9BACT|nr:hypothetical protein [Nannocystis radixulma]MDC0666958.1 hypothetical protein [Nannocystis radixulma]
MIFATIAAASCVRRPASSEVTTAASFSLAELRAEVDRYVCAVWTPEVQQWGVAMLGEACGAVRDPALGEVGRAVVEKSRTIVPLATAAYDAFDAGASGLDQASADALARRSMWSDPLLSRAILLQLRSALDARHVRCDDCPRLTVAPVELEWEDFVPYLRAYFWPVQSTPGGPVDIFTCSGTNGAAELPANEPLRQAGFLVAAQFIDDAEMTAQIEQLHARHNGDASRSAHGMAREIDAWIQSPTGRARTCRALREVEWFTGVVVRACEPTPRG